MAKKSRIGFIKQAVLNPNLSKRQIVIVLIVALLWTLFPLDDIFGFGLGSSLGGFLAPILAWGDEAIIWTWFVNALISSFKSTTNT